MAGSHNKSYHHQRKNKASSSRAQKDPERQGSFGQPSDFMLTITGFHAFCAVSLYSTPYGAMQGGWTGLLFLGMYFVFSLLSSIQIAKIVFMYPSIKTYSDVGREAFGDRGGQAVSFSDFLLNWASCVESVMISYAAIVYASPEPLVTYMDSRSKLVVGIIWVIVTALMALVCNLVDVEAMDRGLSCLGASMNFIVVACLLWMYLFNPVKESKSTKKVIDLLHWPMANAFFALCFAGHTSLPKLYSSMRDKNDVQYVGIIITMFVVSMWLYGFAALIGYQLFGANVQSIYVLNMPIEYVASKVAIGTVLIHQFVRYIMGVHVMVTSVTEEIQEHKKAWTVFYTCLVVIITIPVTILAPRYSTVMAFIGSILGIVVSLVIPCVCSIQLMSLHMGNYERFVTILILVMAFVALVAGVASPFLQN